MRAFLVSLFAALLLSGAALAKGDEPRVVSESLSELHLPEAWGVCLWDYNCVSIDTNCRPSLIAVNVRYEARAEAAICEKYDCDPTAVCDKSLWFNHTYTVCEKGVCKVMDDPNFVEKKSNPNIKAEFAGMGNVQKNPPAPFDRKAMKKWTRCGLQTECAWFTASCKGYRFAFNKHSKQAVEDWLVAQCGCTPKDDSCMIPANATICSVGECALTNEQLNPTESTQ